MAAIQNLEVLVEVNVSEALASLSELQDELSDLAEKIETVDKQGSEGIDIRTSVDDLDAELAALKAEMEAFEAANDIDIDTDVDNLDQLFAAHGRGPQEILGRMGGLGSDRPIDLNFPSYPTSGKTIGTTREGRTTTRLARLGRTLRKVTPEMSDFKLRMSSMHNALATLIPVLLVFIGAIPAAITAILGLAAAAASAAAALIAIGAFGALGVGLEGGEFKMDNLKDVLEDIKDSFIEAFAPLAERLQPLFMDAVDGLEHFFNAIARQGDALMSLTDEARDFGSFLIDYIPDVLRSMAATVQAFRPVFEDIADYLRDATILRTLTDLAMQAIPVFAEMTQKIIEALPAIVKMSIGFARVATVIIDAISGFAWLLSLVGIGPELFGLLAGAALTLATTFSLLNTAIVGSLISSLAKLGAMVVGHIGRLLGLSAANVIATISSWGLYTALMALIGLITLGAGLALGGAILEMASDFDVLGGEVDQAVESLKDFDNVANGTGSDFNPYSGANGAPRSGAQQAGMPSGGSGGTTINIESSGNQQDDKSNAKYAGWRQGRTTGGGR